MKVQILLLTLLTTLATSAGAEVFVVEPQGLMTIQEAIDLCDDNDVVELMDGVYTGDGNRDLVLGGKEITIRSASGDPTTCIIDCQATQNDQHRGFTLDGGETLNTVIEGITLRGGYSDYAGGVVAEIATIRNCHFINNVGIEGGGITMMDSGVIEDCLIVGNSAANGGGISVCCYPGAMATLNRCTFVGNTATDYGGGFRA